MSIPGACRARVRALVRRTTAARELDDEIRFHIDAETAKNVRAGMSPDEARRVATAHFGGVQRVREEHWDVRRARWIEDFFADVRFALRALRRTPALAGAAILTLSLGIGANVAIFSAVNAVVLQPLPFPAQDRLMVITEENPEKHWHLQVAAPANLLDWRDGVSDFQDVTGYFDALGPATLTGRGDPQILQASGVMGNFFSTLGVHAAMGRTLTDAETWHDPKDQSHVLVLSDRGWRDHFDADPDIVGKSAVLDGQTFQIVGVMPPSFAYPQEDVDCWQSVEWNPARRGDVSFRRAHYVRAVARLKPGASQAHAAAQLAAVVARLKRDYPATNRFMGAEMMPLHDFLIGNTRLPLLVLLTSVAFLLLIACANVGNLLLVQAAGRSREAALRMALGADRRRLVRQALTESLVLSVLGGALGVFLGWLGTRVLVRLQPAGMLRVHDFGVDGAVLFYAIAITIGSTLVFGVAPALWTRRRDPADSLKEGGRGSAQGARPRRWQDTLVVAEVALALIMSVGAGLLVRSFMQVRAVDPGFDPHGELASTVAVNATYDTSTKILAFANQLEARARAIPGVVNATLASNVPFAGAGYTTDFIIAGRPAGEYGTEIENRSVTPSYFSTMKVPVLRGRTFSAEDREGSTPVLVINAELAAQYFRGQDPVGQRLAFAKVATPTTTWYTIIGVVGSEHVDALDVAPRIEAFHAMAQQPSGYMVLVTRTRGDAAALTPDIRRILHDIDPSLALLTVTTMDALQAKSMARERFLTALLILFAVVGTLLSAVGVYGVLAQMARNRTREMGIRLALGARESQVRWLVVNQGLRLSMAGLMIGGLVALFATRAMRSLLFNVAPDDPLTIAAVVVLLTLTSVVAAWVPASKASRADPSTTLRAD